jgi:transcription initiation factor IIE alpha subunit
MVRIPGFNNAPRDVLPKEYVVDLTPEGVKKVNSLEGSGADLVIMAKIAERGPCDKTELSKATGMDEEKVKAVINQLGRKGFVRRTN